MKIAITADLHLTTREQHPERYHALENILSQMIEEEVKTLIIAGDLFDASLRNYAELEALCKDPQWKDIAFYIIPGNHDPGISSTSIVGDNLHIYTETEIVELDSGSPRFLMAPYKKGISMGESIAELGDALAPQEWILIGHGDWSEGLRERNPYEPGVYMPLTSKDVARYQPLQVFLGHIHAPFYKGRIHYAGSPCGLDITEKGKRRFLIYDTDTDEIEIRFVDTDVIYFDEFFVMIPMEDEMAYIKELVEERIRSWQISKQDREKVRVRVKVGGYCLNREALLVEIGEAFAGYAFYNNKEPDIADLSISEDADRKYIAEKVKARVDELEWPIDPDEPDKQEILEAALKVIYEG